MQFNKWSTTDAVISMALPSELSRVASSTVIVTGSNTGIGR